MRVDCHVGGCCVLFMQWDEVIGCNVGLERHGGWYSLRRFDVGLVLCREWDGLGITRNFFGKITGKN